MKELESYPEVQKLLNGKSKGTRLNYKSAILVYMEYTNLNPTQLIDEAEADEQKSKRERGVPKQRILGFNEWLLTKYQQKTRGPRNKNKARREKVGISENLASTYCSAIRSFYRDNGFRIDVKLGKPSKKKENFKLIMRTPEVSKLLNVASLRDRAVIKLMFESCQGISEVCGLNIGDIKQYEDIWQFHIIRKKTSTEFYSEVGEETIEFLKLYFEERRRSGEELNDSSPLFVKEGRMKSSFERITPNLIEGIFKTLAIKSGLVTIEQMKKADLNPARPHSLRAGGMSVLKLEGCPEKWVEFRAGHEGSETDTAYWLTRPEESRQLFQKHYNALRVKPVTQFDVTEVKKLREIVAEGQVTITALSENGRIKIEQIQALTKEASEQKEVIKGLVTALHEVEDRLTSLEQERENEEIRKSLPKVSTEEIKKAKEKFQET
jgi:integrase